MERAPAEHTGKAHTHKTVGVKGNNSATIIRFSLLLLFYLSLLVWKLIWLRERKGTENRK